MGLAHHSLCDSVVEHQNTESKGLRFDCLWELTRNLFLGLCSWQDKKKSFSISLPSPKLTIFLILFTRLYQYDCLLVKLFLSEDFEHSQLPISGGSPMHFPQIVLLMLSVLAWFCMVASNWYIMIVHKPTPRVPSVCFIN